MFRLNMYILRPRQLHPFCQQESTQAPIGVNPINVRPDVPVEHAHQDMEAGGLGVVLADSKAGAGLPGDPGFSPPPEGFWPGVRVTAV